MTFVEIQAALPLLLQLLFIVAVGALLVGSFLAIIKFIVKNSIIIIAGLILFLAYQNGILDGVL